MDNNIQEQKAFSFFRLLRANMILIVLTTVVVTMLSVLYSVLYVKPVYMVSRSVVLRAELNEDFNKEGQEATNAALAKDLLIIQMEQHFRSTKYVEMANEVYQTKYPDSQSKINSNSIYINYKTESLIFTISYKDLDKDVAREKLIAIYDVNSDYFDGEFDFTITLIPTDNASENATDRFVYSVSNSTAKYVFLGLGLGLVMAVVVVLIKNSLDNTVKDSAELEELTGASVIATIHKQEDESRILE